MDIVGPLSKSVRGHQYILVIIDYATRYPEAVSLRKANAKQIARTIPLQQPGRVTQGDPYRYREPLYVQGHQGVV